MQFFSRFFHISMGHSISAFKYPRFSDFNQSKLVIPGYYLYQVDIRADMGFITSKSP